MQNIMVILTTCVTPPAIYSRNCTRIYCQDQGYELDNSNIRR